MQRVTNTFTKNVTIMHLAGNAHRITVCKTVLMNQLIALYIWYISIDN